MTVHITTIMACRDCLLLVANDDLPEERPDLWKEIDRYLRLRPGQYLACGDADQDEEFSWRSCECCGSRLGGSRHQLAIITPKTEETS